MHVSGEERRQAGRDAAAALERARVRGEVRRAGALIGFDGFVDSIIDVVDRRTAPGPTGYQRMETIGALADRIARAAGRSGGIELVVKRVKAGGNAVIMAEAMARLGAPVRFIGAVAESADAGKRGVHPVFEEFARLCVSATPIAPPGFTDALEFSDGKVMLGKPASLDEVTWERVLRGVGGADALARMIDEARVFAMGNWTQTAGMDGVWRGLVESILPRTRDARDKRVFVDLADPSKRSDDELRAAVEELRAIDKFIPVTLGLNLAEATRLCRTLGADAASLPEGEPEWDRFGALAATARRLTGLSRLALHRRRGAALASAGGVVSFEGAFTRHPALSTGAGDHFNAGFAFADALGLEATGALATAAAVSGWYVRKAASPTFDEMVGFLKNLPASEV